MSALARLREAVAATTQPQLERGRRRRRKGDDDFDADDQGEGTDADASEELEDEAAPDSKKKAREAFRYLLREAHLQRSDGAYEATVLREGPGNARDRRYYTKQALRQAVADRLFEGLQAYANHPTAAEERDRPERDVRQLVGHFREARYVEQGGRGRVVAKFVPIDGEGYGWVRSLIESALKSPEDRPLIGISIDGYGHTPDRQEIGGRTYDMVREIAHLGSADIVTRAGAGGAFHRRLQEAWRAAEDNMRLRERDFSAKQRKSAKKSGAAMDDGSYPIYNQEDANNAWKLRGRGKGHSEAAIVAHIRKRVKALGLKMPGGDDDKTRESDPAGQAGASEEVSMKPAILQEKIKASVAKLREASQIEDDDERAENLIQEALGELDECSTATVSKQVEVREVEKPVAAGDSDADKLAVELEQTKTRLTEAEEERDEALSMAQDARDELTALKRGQLALKVMREAEITPKLAQDWFDQVVACEDEESMKRVVERKKDAVEELLKPIRESLGVEGVPARIPALNGAVPSEGGLLERMGIDRDELGS